jgi:hypothetical protein
MSASEPFCRDGDERWKQNHQEQHDQRRAEVASLTASLRAKRSNPSRGVKKDGLLRHFAHLRKRFAFVARNDGR